MTPLARFRAFEERFARAQATAVVEYGWGYGLRQADFPASWHHNRLVVTGVAPAPSVLAAVDELLADAGHRTVHVDGSVPGAAEAFAEAGYSEHERIMPMVFTGARPARPSGVVEVSADELAPALVGEWRAAYPDGDEDDNVQLGERVRLYSRGAEVTFLAVRVGGRIVAHLDLYEGDGVSQLENLATQSEHRGHGYARALLAEGLWRSVHTPYLTAEATDWPRQWYRSLGFREIGTTELFQRKL